MRRPAARRASAMMSSAGMPQIAAAQAASFGWPSLPAEQIGLELSPADAEAVEKRAVMQSLG